MKKTTLSANNQAQVILFSLISFFLLPTEIKAQVRVPFTQRSATETPSKYIYNLKGDFTMLGNTNLTLVSYSDINDNNQAMKYVDIDSDSQTLNSSSATLALSTENGALPSCSTIIFAGLYWTGKALDSDTFSVTKGGVTKNYDKKEVYLKGPLASSYTTITANASDIWYPGSGDDGIYVGYKEITDYVKTNGIGNYTVADIALTEGAGPTPGYSGGWGIIVVYSNPLMKSRDITIFDGYAYVNSGTSGSIPISGFKAVLTGQVNMKLGVMASEGDRNRVGDYLEIKKLNTSSYLRLFHSGNATVPNDSTNSNNFFNSSIETNGNTRNPNLINNTGIDLSMFYIPNAGNSTIANGQTSTVFNYGSSADKFSIFGLAMSVDAYVPEPEGVMTVNTINGVSNPPLTVLPGQEIEYVLKIKNKGTEETNNTLITIPISNTTDFVISSISYTLNAPLITTTGLPYYDAVTKSIIWNIGNLPVKPNDPNFLLGTLTFKLRATDDCSTLINASCNSVISVSGTISGVGSISGISFSESIFKGFDNSSGCDIPIPTATTVALDSSGSPCFTTLAGPDQIVSCGLEAVQLAAITGTIGTWSIVSGPAGGGEVFSDITSPISNFTSPNIGVYTLRWTTGCASTKDDVVVNLINCNTIDFDGIDDNVSFKNNYNLSSGPFSIETWIKPNATNGNTQTILSKRFAPNSTDGYDLRLVNDYISFNWNNGNSITSAYNIGTDRWYHIAVTFDGTNYMLYIDGIAVQTPASGTNPTQNTSVDCILGAMDQITKTPFNHFNGWIDEIRIWKVALTVNQIRQMLNQEITQNGTGVKGGVIPLDIIGLVWDNLDGYYQMNQTTDITNGYLLNKTTSSANGKIKNIYTPQADTAPLPYTSRVSGQDWYQDDTWTNYAVWDAPNSVGIDDATMIDWNIVKTSHNISSNGNKTILGLVVNSNTLSAINDSKIQVSNYLKLDGKLDLVGKSQLIQTEGSVLDATSSGSIERDQQGTNNIYNYNYWSAPVGPINAVTNNNNYTVGGVFKDGTNVAGPTNINWIGGYNGASGTPIHLARYWIYKFQNLSNAYANWTQVLETGTLAPAQGFTLKGSGTGSAKQNYTFIGKPFNSTISNPIAANNLNLSGNPYASAIDANAFITDNATSTNGTLYFWEHYATNNTHYLNQYQGGYATRNLTGGTVPISPALISGLGSSTRIPGRFIPVGQAFFIKGNATGGNIVFKNSQRIFVKEDDMNSNVMFRNTASSSELINSNDAYEEDIFSKIRLGYTSQDNFHRQVLLGFMNEKATSDLDYGYDGLLFDELVNDMYFLHGTTKLIIQGDGFFNANSIYPIAIKSAVAGNVKFMIDGLENFNSGQPIYIHDNQTNTYHDIRNEIFEVDVTIGENTTRFSLRFNQGTLSVDNNNNISEINITHIQNGNILVINNALLDVTVQKVDLFNIIGQSIKKWDVKNEGQQNIQIPIQNCDTGTYIARIQTSKGTISKQLIIK